MMAACVFLATEQRAIKRLDVRFWPVVACREGQQTDPGQSILGGISQQQATQ